MRHDSFGEARAGASGAGLFLWLTGGARRIVRRVRCGFLATRPADRTTQEFRLILHHVEALPSPRRKGLARCGWRLHGLDDGLWLIGGGRRAAHGTLDRRRINRLAAVFGPLGSFSTFRTFRAVGPIIALGAVATLAAVAAVAAVEAPVAEAGVVAAAVIAMIVLAPVLVATVVLGTPLVLGPTAVVAAVFMTRFGPRILA